MVLLMRRLGYLFAQISTFGAVVVGAMGYEYMTVGHGLHPILAGSIATLLVLAPHLITVFDSDEKLW